MTMSSLAADLEGSEQAPGAPLTAEGLLRRRAAQYPQALALADPPNRDVLSLGAGRSFTYREADVRVDALARFFVALGLAPRDCIAVQLPNSAEQPLTMLAAWRAGLTVVMLPALWRRMEIAKVCAELKPRTLIGAGGTTGESPVETLRVIATSELLVRFVLGFGRDLPDGVMSLDEALEGHQARPRTPSRRGSFRVPP
jgi:non-ribosomal peptide synthetase component E (peptide arylation enzyme)